MIGIKTANIYINFSEIMEEEHKDLWEFINEEHIVAKDVTKNVIDLQQRINKAIKFVEDYQNQLQGEEIEYDMKQLLKILRGEE